MARRTAKSGTVPEQSKDLAETDLPGTDLAATRAKLTDAAGAIFAERGFQATTVREICAAAGANVAAVNYHFGDKLGLYSSVLREMTQATHASTVVPAFTAEGSPEDRLRLLIATMLRSMTSDVKTFRMMRIVAHELASPTPVLDQVVDEFIGPSQARLCKLVGEILGMDPGEETTRLCALSIVGQVLHFAKARPVITRLWPRMKYAERDIDLIAAHVASFTLAALHGLRKSKSKTPRGDMKHGK
jgi:AcrR family transcriptional regulator